MFPRDILNKIRWTGNPGLEKIEVYYIHRGSAGNLKMIEGHQIKDLERSHFVIGRGIGFGTVTTTSIPYHRIEKIMLDEMVIYDRNEYRKKDAA